MRTNPNIIITGTPGVGKTSHAEAVAEATGLKHIQINKFAEENGCYDGRDEELGSWIVDEDKLLDALEKEVPEGGYILDWHACDLFPKSWIDLVVVIRCDSDILYDRLAARKYNKKKLEENMDAEIMQVLLEEARGAYDEQQIVEIQSNKLEDLDENVGRMEAWVRLWKKDKQFGH
ncbi:P-loop containing nucleoside triphosphate hydrolase protein [Trichodelitschia bisporula]|uniref:Adenylate kinase isoenzyme 6 homolog n=1 Tax=Trichodelitschia bisporula TaxID=703511 RepID=A0A6G1I8N1_9PEZI|nr:P-loop containing nucleoside triphosphate hydrolase protein [Trichodelitschia bisporula]